MRLEACPHKYAEADGCDKKPGQDVEYNDEEGVPLVDDGALQLDAVQNLVHPAHTTSVD